jgi:putative ABC transport system permease protein
VRRYRDRVTGAGVAVSRKEPKLRSMLARGGGAPARRAMAHWAWRLLRREWRSQILLVALLTLTVAGAVFGGSAAYNVTPSPNAQFGSATQLLSFDGADPRALAANIAAARRAFGTIETIGHRYVPIPGSVETVEFRSQSPSEPYGRSMLALRQGRYPAGPGEADLTEGLTRTLGIGIGGSLRLGGQDRKVVGIVENPLVLSDQFALISPVGAGPVQSATVLFKSTLASFGAFRSSRNPLAAESLAGRPKTAVVLVLVAATLLLLLIALVAAAGFAVIAQRRLRQLGMLAAMGATKRNIRLVMLASGAMVGGIAAAAGTVIGAALWILLSPWLETAANHRIDRLSLPWTIVLGVIVLALVTAIGAAWWPARMVARVPVTEALSNRPPHPRPTHRSAVMGAVFLVAGAGCLALSGQSKPPLLIAGMLGMALGILYLSPIAIRFLAALGGRGPLAVRLSLRDLARHQARSAAALAAIGLALGIAFALIVAVSAAQHPASSGNLSDHQILIQMGEPGDPVIPVHTSTELQTLAVQVHQIAATLQKPQVVSLAMPIDPAIKPVPPSPDGSTGGQPVAELDIPAQGASADQGPRQSGTFSVYPLYVATPQLLRYLGVDPAAVPAATDMVSVHSGDLSIENVSAPQTMLKVKHLAGPAYSAAPTSAMSLSGIARRHWTQIAAGWLVQSSEPITSAQAVEARHIAALAGLTIVTRDDQRSLVAVRQGAAGAGVLLALGVLAMTVGLIRREAANDLRILVAAGATSNVRRMLTAATASGLALAGVVLGLGGAYLGLVAAYDTHLGTLSHVPVVYLLSVAVCAPVVAFLAGWLLAGRPPSGIARSVMD